jgi:hypothetical protein
MADSHIWLLTSSLPTLTAVDEFLREVRERVVVLTPNGGDSTTATSNVHHEALPTSGSEETRVSETGIDTDGEQGRFTLSVVCSTISDSKNSRDGPAVVKHL